MSKYINSIKLNKLIINPDNYRHESVNSESEAIKVMLNNYDKKIRKLLEDIIFNGTNPSDLPIVTPQNNKFIVLEGNRRIIALKILENPKILKEITPELYEPYKKIIENAKYSNKYTKIDCCVISDPSEADKWIKVKHTGENGGIGTVQWTNLQRKKFDESVGKTDTSLTLVKYVKSSPFYRNDLKEKLHSLKLSNLSRLIDDPHVRESIGLSKSNGELFKLYPDNELSKGLSKLLSDLLNKDFNVKSIYLKHQRIDYISKFTIDNLPDPTTKLSKQVPLNELISTSNEEIIHDKDQIEFEDITTSSIKTCTSRNTTINADQNKNETTSNITITDSIISTPKNQKPIDNFNLNGKLSATTLNSKNKPRIMDARDINNRKFLIPTSFNVRIKDARTNLIYKELKSLDIARYTNAVSISFRVFLEFSVDKFIESNNIDGINVNTKLRDKIQKCVNFLQSKNLITKDEAKPVHTSIAAPNSIFSIDTFNNYIHNPNMFPDVLHLKTTWNQLSKFILKLHENI